jgi:anaerobic magnesium-protoporphyrin IX monomethyl ester cyclase
MKVALINPRWTFDGSIYFGCREPHLPLEYGYAKALLTRAGHLAEIIDAQAEGIDETEVASRVAELAPDMTVVTTAPSYLFWRCAPPELGVPQRTLAALGHAAGSTLAIGPHGSTTPRATLRKLGVEAVVLGECEETLVRLAELPRSAWRGISGLCHVEGGEVLVQGGPKAADMASLPALAWPADALARHRHHHHRFDSTPAGPGAAVPITVLFARKTTSGTITGAARSPRFWPSSMGLSPRVSRISTLSTRFFCPGASSLKRSRNGR